MTETAATTNIDLSVQSMESQHHISQVNAPPAQTWNYLQVNGITLALTMPHSSGEVFARLPRAFNHIETGIGAQANAWVEASAHDAVFFEVKADEQRKLPLEINVCAGQHIDAGILVREGAEATIVVLASDSADADSVPGNDSATLVRIIAERNARVSVVEIVAAQDDRTHVGGIGIAAQAGAAIDVRQYAVGAGACTLGIATELIGDAASLTHTMRYLVRNSSVLDANHVVRMRGRATRADVATSGVLTNGSSKTLRETIDLVRGAKGARGNESETVLVSGDRIINKTLPTILCDEEDVAGNHGASIGAISSEQLSYLANRGIGKQSAQALFARAVFDDALMHASTATARSAVLACAARALDNATASDMAEMLADEEGE